MKYASVLLAVVQERSAGSGEPSAVTVRKVVIAK